MEFDELTR